MYDMYPDWGPRSQDEPGTAQASRRDTRDGWAGTRTATVARTDPRDGAGERPDDN